MITDSVREISTNSHKSFAELLQLEGDCGNYPFSNRYIRNVQKIYKDK